VIHGPFYHSANSSRVSNGARIGSLPAIGAAHAFDRIDAAAFIATLKAKDALTPVTASVPAGPRWCGLASRTHREWSVADPQRMNERNKQV
jgi:hypothetical protein